MRDCCPILVIPDISWDSVKEGHMGPAVIQLCIHVTADELRFDVFSAHTGRLSVNIRSKKCGIGELLTRRGGGGGGGGLKARRIYLQCIGLKQSHAAIKNYLFSNTSSSFGCSRLADCF